MNMKKFYENDMFLIPNDIVIFIFGFLTKNDILPSCLVCKYWNTYIKENIGFIKPYLFTNTKGGCITERKELDNHLNKKFPTLNIDPFNFENDDINIFKFKFIKKLCICVDLFDNLRISRNIEILSVYSNKTKPKYCNLYFDNESNLNTFICLSNIKINGGEKQLLEKVESFEFHGCIKEFLYLQDYFPNVETLKINFQNIDCLMRKIYSCFKTLKKLKETKFYGIISKGNMDLCFLILFNTSIQSFKWCTDIPSSGNGVNSSIWNFTTYQLKFPNIINLHLPFLVNPNQFPNLKKFKFHYIGTYEEFSNTSIDKENFEKLLPFMDSVLSFDSFQKFEISLDTIEQIKYLIIYRLRQIMNSNDWLNIMTSWISEELQSNIKQKQQILNIYLFELVLNSENYAPNHDISIRFFEEMLKILKLKDSIWIHFNYCFELIKENHIYVPIFMKHITGLYNIYSNFKSYQIIFIIKHWEIQDIKIIVYLSQPWFEQQDCDSYQNSIKERIIREKKLNNQDSVKELIKLYDIIIKRNQKCTKISFQKFIKNLITN